MHSLKLNDATLSAMKYMGSKRAMLKNGLGILLTQEVKDAQRFVDLFCGSGAVASFVAQQFEVPVWAYDLQKYGAVLASAIVERTTPLDWVEVWDNWHQEASELFTRIAVLELKSVTKRAVINAREWCKLQSDFPICKAYGGHYFSPEQALWFDCLRSQLPKKSPARSVALAALIQAASQCVAAPGHTAQPFQPTATGKAFVAEAWGRDVVSRTRNCLEKLALQHARIAGGAKVADANVAASSLKEGDVVFIDPPYSGVHYSRFYHVLETISSGECGEVTGVGRYPDRTQRPISRYSMRGQSTAALEELFSRLAKSGAKGILTFPAHECSNGLTGASVKKLAKDSFSVTEKIVTSRFSTLGGNTSALRQNGHRPARQQASELILILNCKS